ncbi:MAG TPA: hypothetical protein PKI32_08360, partial [Opitutales bacterium]|nr:hypothetical protein [Opitutales bacterium]
GKQTFTGIDVRLGAGNALLLSVLKRNLLSKLFISTATKKFESGHAALDREFIFRSNMPEIAMAVVTTPDIRDALLSTQKQHGFSATIEVKPPFLHYQEAGSMTGGKRVARIQAVTLLMVQLAAALDAAASLVNSPRR